MDARKWTESPPPTFPDDELEEEKLSMSASDVYRQMPYHTPRRVSQEGILVLSSMESAARDSAGLWNSSPPTSLPDDRLSMSASDVYRRMPYDAPRRISQEGLPLMSSTLNEDDVAVDADSQTHMQDDANEHAETATMRLESLERSRPPVDGNADDEISDTETHIFSDDDMEMTQRIDDEDDTDEGIQLALSSTHAPPLPEADGVVDTDHDKLEENASTEAATAAQSPVTSSIGHKQSTKGEVMQMIGGTCDSDDDGKQEETAAPDHDHAKHDNQRPKESTKDDRPMQMKADGSDMQPTEHSTLNMSDVMVKDEALDTSMASSTTTLSSFPNKSDLSIAALDKSSDVDVSIESVSSQPITFRDSSLSASIPYTTTAAPPRPPRHPSTTEHPSVQLHTPPDIYSPLGNDDDNVATTPQQHPHSPVDDDDDDDDAEPAPCVPTHLHRRTKEIDYQVAAGGFDFDDNSQQSSSIGSATKKRPYAFLDQNESQSQQTEFQGSPPDLGMLAASTLHAAMHVQGYVSPMTRLMQHGDADTKMAFVTPPKAPRVLRMAADRTPQSTESSNSSRKRPKTELLSPIPPRAVYPKRQVKCLTGLYFYLSGFDDTASNELQSQIRAYGGTMKKVASEMKKLHDVCFVIATAEASRRPKILYAMTCGIPIVHPDWLSACFQAREKVDVAGYWIPSGFSWVFRRSVVHTPHIQPLLFQGMRFGVPYDAHGKKRKEIQRDFANVMKFPLEHCGAHSVKLDVKKRLIEAGAVDVILTNEFTALCAVAAEYGIPIVRFLWVNECIIQQVVDTTEPNFAPDIYDDDGTLYSRVMETTLSNAPSVLDTSWRQRLTRGQNEHKNPHPLLYGIGQVVRLDQAADAAVSIHVQMYKRNTKGDPRSQEIIPTRKVVEIEPSQIRQKACLITHDDYERLVYFDSSVFYMRDT
ncbi:Aste57867_22425 [Aphanomyces stellatus]|uniref:Aste57867_22425 protein n=1 Tax=Aphanomyces stellatus TaxID=120398 RepID=A0A485LPY9_9STRA|nr:hypothetical protein As57867_022355 [Aphanomyces stellatus]VFT99087.1 Aste57867_22425 [Aphanomyces stellatus]